VDRESYGTLWFLKNKECFTCLINKDMSPAPDVEMFSYFLSREAAPKLLVCCFFIALFCKAFFWK
jgi:hypothetical protein